MRMMPIDALRAALAGGAIERVLHRGVRLTIDSGGAASLPAGIVTGRAGSAELLGDLLGRFDDPQDERTEVNGSPGILIRSRGRVVAVIVASARRRLITELWVIANPEKLQHWNAP